MGVSTPPPIVLGSTPLFVACCLMRLQEQHLAGPLQQLQLLMHSLRHESLAVRHAGEVAVFGGIAHGYGSNMLLLDLKHGKAVPVGAVLQGQLCDHLPCTCDLLVLCIFLMCLLHWQTVLYCMPLRGWVHLYASL